MNWKERARQIEAEREAQRRTEEMERQRIIEVEQTQVKEFLQSLNVVEHLTSIRDQVWQAGVVSLKSGYDFGGWRYESSGGALREMAGSPENSPFYQALKERKCFGNCVASLYAEWPYYVGGHDESDGDTIRYSPATIRYSSRQLRVYAAYRGPGSFAVYVAHGKGGYYRGERLRGEFLTPEEKDPEKKLIEYLAEDVLEREYLGESPLLPMIKAETERLIDMKRKDKEMRTVKLDPRNVTEDWILELARRHGLVSD